MAIDSTSALIGAAVGVGAVMVLGSTKKSSGSSKRKKSKGLGATYVVTGTTRKVSAKKSSATKKAAGIGKRRTKKK